MPGRMPDCSPPRRGVPSAGAPRAAFLALLPALAGCSDGGPAPAPLAEAVIDGFGGTLEVDEGLLAGTAITVPAGALAQPTRLWIARDVAAAQPGFRVLGAAAALSPFDLRFLVPVQITLPFRDGTDATVLARRSGRVVELGPSTSPASRRVTVETLAAASFWSVERFAGGVPVAPFLPLGDGNVWNFDGGLTATMTQSSGEPNLGGQSVIVFEFARDGARLGFYLQRTFGPTWSLGHFAALGGIDYQHVHGPALFLPAATTLGQPLHTVHEFEGFQPLGATAGAYAGLGELEFLADHPEPVAVGMRTFDDLLRVRAVARHATPAGAARELEWVLTLARDVGPVAVEVFGVSASLTSATVGGQSVP